MNITTYFLIPLVLFVILLYPLVRKAVALLEILVNKQVQQTTQEKQANTSSTSQTLFNLKLLAYERIILFIERIKPDSFIPPYPFSLSSLSGISIITDQRNSERI